MISFHRHRDEEGWRSSLGYRCRQEAAGWHLQRWAGPVECWVTLATGLPSYAKTRQAATDYDRHGAVSVGGE